MKKKYRDIIVDDIKYTWAVTNYNCDGDGGFMVKIWLDKKIFYDELVVGETITPRVIEETIRELNEHD